MLFHGRAGATVWCDNVTRDVVCSAVTHHCEVAPELDNLTVLPPRPPDDPPPDTGDRDRRGLVDVWLCRGPWFVEASDFEVSSSLRSATRWHLPSARITQVPVRGRTCPLRRTRCGSGRRVVGRCFRWWCGWSVRRSSFWFQFVHGSAHLLHLASGITREHFF